MKDDAGSPAPEDRPAPRDDRVRSWLDHALADADRRELPELKPLIEALALSTEALRAADWNDDDAR
jgi:hypothetical protein